VHVQSARVREDCANGLTPVITGWEEFARSLEAQYGTDFVADFCQTLRDEQRAEQELAFQKQKRIAEATQRLDACWMDGLGEMHMSLDPEVYFHWVRKEGKDCWNNKQFIREFKRDNPEVIVRAKSRKTMLVRP